MEHGENTKYISTQPSATPIGTGVISEMDGVRLDAAQTQASQLIAAVQCLALPIPTEMGTDDRWH
jgi:hypothetical protein